MNTSEKSLWRILGEIFAVVSVMFVCSVPLFYATISLDAMGIYVAARAIRFLMVIAIGCVIRRKNCEDLVQNESGRAAFIQYTAIAICVSIVLHFTNITPTLYATITASIGAFDLKTTPLFLAVLWEQIFAGDLYWSILSCLAIVFFRRGVMKNREKKKA